MPNQTEQIDGILNVNKPYGITSMDVVRRVKRASGQKRVGHGGTLDPIATGVAPICMGQATRVMEYLVDGKKEYRAVVELGVSTDTYDAMGEVVKTGDASGVALEDIQNALKGFLGEIDQVPPMYSALKKDGKRLYDLARAGIEIEREPRKVMVYGIELLAWSPPHAALVVRCGRGFYMRSLAHDLGELLGCGGHLKSLERARLGPFHVGQALTLEQAEELFQHGGWRDAVHAPDVVLSHMPAAIVGRRIEDVIRHGQPISHALRIPTAKPDDKCRVYSVDGRFLAVITFDATKAEWRPDKVFALRYAEPARV